MNIPRKEDFMKKIEDLKKEARENKRKSIDINAGDLHKILGDFKGKDARMHSCCLALYDSMKPQDDIIELPKPQSHNVETKGYGSRLTIRYNL